jgi:quercetin dioxygenase-like cupin family protein
VKSILVIAAVVLLLPRAAAAQAYAAEVEVTPIVQTDTTAAGTPFAYPRTGDAEITALVVEIPAGAETGRHLHPQPTFVYVLEGTLEVEADDGTVRTFHPGDGFVEVVDTWHNGRNAGATLVRVLVVFAGARGEPNVVRPE